jgi:hypothetical protein
MAQGVLRDHNAAFDQLSQHIGADFAPRFVGVLCLCGGGRLTFSADLKDITVPVEPWRPDDDRTLPTVLTGKGG